MTDFLEGTASWWPYLATALGAYLIGSLSFAILLSRLFGLPDPRQIGSKNPGATNMLRSGRRLVALLTLFGDLFKGWIVVFTCQRWTPFLNFSDGLVALAGLAVFLGHLYPIYFGFKGGKGVATAFGVLIGLSGSIALIAILAWLLVVYFCRYVSLASIVAAVAATIAMLLSGSSFSLVDRSIFCLMMALLVWRHRANIQRLVLGQENKLSSKSSPSS